MVVGEPGIGKTALCEQLATYVSIRGGRTLVGHCYEEGSLSLPYLAFVEAMRTYVLSRDPDGLKSDLGSGAADVARIVSEVRDRVSVELRDASDPEDDRWRLLQSVTTFLRNAASVQPLVIVLEDLHWADRGTLDLLQHVARNLQGARLVVVGTYRDVEVDRSHPLSGAVAELRRSGSFLRLPLRGLTVDEVHRMYESLRGNEVPWNQAEQVHRQTEGNPLFVQEVLRYLVEEGIVVREGGRYVAQQPGEGVPEGLRDVIGRRLSHLDDKTNTVLSVASVVGRDFRLDVLQKVAGLGEEDLYAALEEASERAIVEQVHSPGGVAFRFTHAMFRTLLYEEIFAPRRIRLHQQVGRALEEIYARRLEEHAAELAEHFTQSTEAADLEKAVRYGELAAERATGVFAYGEAVRHLEQALRAQDVLDSDDLVRNCDLQLALGEALLAMSDRKRLTQEVAPAVLSLAQRLEDDARAWRACRLVLEVSSGVQTPELTEWQGIAERYVEHDLRARIRLNRSKAGVALQLGRRREAAALLRESLPMARTIGDLDAEFGIAFMAMAFSVLEPDEVLQLIEDFVPRPRTGVTTQTLTFFLGGGAGAILGWGDRKRFEELLNELKVLADRTHHVGAISIVQFMSATLLCMDGHLEESSELFLQSMRSSIPPPGGMIPVALLYLGRINELLEVRDAFPAGIANQPVVRLTLARYLLEGGDKEAASEILSQSLALVPTGSEADLVDFLAYMLLEVSIGAGNSAAVERFYEAMMARPRGNTMIPLAGICKPRDLGKAAVMLGRVEEARQHMEEALAFCEQIRHRPDIALCHLDLAELLLEHYPEERDAAIDHLDFAIAELRDMKMQPALERALGRRGLLKA
jgi:tetratricopeptide (TPR) repeat protein